MLPGSEWWEKTYTIHLDDSDESSDSDAEAHLNDFQCWKFLTDDLVVVNKWTCVQASPDVEITDEKRKVMALASVVSKFRYRGDRIVTIKFMDNDVLIDYVWYA